MSLDVTWCIKCHLSMRQQVLPRWGIHSKSRRFPRMHEDSTWQTWDCPIFSGRRRAFWDWMNVQFVLFVWIRIDLQTSLCISAECTECSWPCWPRWLVRILCIYAQSGPNERWEYLRVCGLSHASRICGVATDFGPRCDPKLGRFRGVV